jgi:hypothetical protein
MEENAMTDIERLTDQQAINAVRVVARQWLDHEGARAHVVISNAEEFRASHDLSIPAWITGMPGDLASMSEAELAQAADYCRAALHGLLSANDERVRRWTQDSISEVSKDHLQSVEVLLAIKGAILIGMILAARVEKIDKKGGIKFYKELPKGLGKLLAAAGKFLSGD